LIVLTDFFLCRCLVLCAHYPFLPGIIRRFEVSSCIGCGWERAKIIADEVISKDYGPYMTRNAKDPAEKQ